MMKKVRVSYLDLIIRAYILKIYVTFLLIVYHKKCFIYVFIKEYIRRKCTKYMYETCVFDTVIGTINAF